MYHSPRIMSARRIAALSLAFALAGGPSAYAYVDPGAGSLVLQLILGGIAGALVTLRLFWNRLRGRGRRERDAAAKE